MSKKPGFTLIPNDTIDDPTLQPNEKLLLITLKRYAFGDRTTCDPSHKALAQALGGKSTKQIGRLLASLETKERIIQEKRTGKRTRYHISNLEPQTPMSRVTPDTSVPTPRTPMSHEEEKKKKGKKTCVYPHEVALLISQFTDARRFYCHNSYQPQFSDTRCARELLRTHPNDIIKQYLEPFFTDPSPLIKADPSLPRFTAWLKARLKQAEQQQG